MPAERARPVARGAPGAYVAEEGGRLQAHDPASERHVHGETQVLPHGLPMRFELESDGSVVLPAEHPLARDGHYPTTALVELAAQLLGRALRSRLEPAGAAGGVLVELRDLQLQAASLPAGTRLHPEVMLERPSPPLPRGRVVLPGALSVQLTLLVRSP